MNGPNSGTHLGLLCLWHKHKKLGSSRYQLLLLSLKGQSEVLLSSLQNLLDKLSFRHQLGSLTERIQGSECHSKCRHQFCNTQYQIWSLEEDQLSHIRSHRM